MSKWDNRKIWERYSYERYGIIGEPYFVLDFKTWYYLTDTGMGWNTADVSVRDKVDSAIDYRFNHTDEIAQAFRAGKMPSKVMINTHPQRWNDGLIAWGGEFILQHAKNVVKKQLVKRQQIG